MRYGFNEDGFDRAGSFSEAYCGIYKYQSSIQFYAIWKISASIIEKGLMVHIVVEAVQSIVKWLGTASDTSCFLDFSLKHGQICR